MEGYGINKWRILLGLAVGLFMASIEGTIVPIAMPRAILELGGQGLYNWPITVFIFASTVSIPIWGRISDLYGRRPVYLGGLILFSTSSLLCGISWSIESLILFRLIQGLGSGAIFVLTFTIIGDLFSLEERGRVTGYTSTVWAVGSILGPPLGGFIVEGLGWRWVYLINIPPATAALLLSLKNLRLPVVKHGSRSLDVKGFTLFTISVTCILLLLDAPILGVTASLPVLATMSLAIPLLIITERRAATPFIPFRALKDRVNLTSSALNITTGFVFFGVVTIIPPLLQWFYGLSPTEAGLVMAPVTFGWVAAANLSSRLIVRIGPGPLLRAGVGLFVAALGVLSASLATASTYWLVLAPLILMGVCMGIIVPSTLITIQTLADSTELGFLTSALAFFRSLGGSIGSQAMWAPFSGIEFTSAGAGRIAGASLTALTPAVALLLLNLPLVVRVDWPDLRLVRVGGRLASDNSS